MICFLSGGAKNGKSSLAQDLAVSLGERRYYVATMDPVDEEDRQRIARHVADRAGLGFETVEQPRNLTACLDRVDREGVFLIDSATALLMNELFPPERAFQPDPAAPLRCAQDLEHFVTAVRHAVVVSDYICADAEDYDEVTELYRRGLAAIDRRLARLSDVVVELSAGQRIVHKGALWL